MTTQRKRIVLGLGVLLGLAAIAFVILSSRHRDLVLIGVIDANDVIVTPRVQARLDSLLVDEGSEVEAGQLIASLESTELAAQAASVAATASSMAAQLRESRSSALQVSGSTEAAVSAARARLASASAALTREESQLAQDSADARRANDLAGSGGMSRADIEKAMSTLHVQEAVTASRRQEVAAAEADLANARAGAHAVAAATSQVATTEARLRGARADSLAAMTRLQYTELRAPVAGVVQVLSARRGELVGPGTPVVVIVDPSHLWVRVAMPETDAGTIAVGDSLTVRVATGDELRGRVISKAAEGEFATQRDVSAQKRDIRAVAFRVAIPNPHRTLVPGMTAQVLVPRKS
jgi:multidrug resistance efflux pump